MLSKADDYIKLLQRLFFHIQFISLFPSQYIGNRQNVSASGKSRHLLPAPNGKCWQPKNVNFPQIMRHVRETSFFWDVLCPFNSRCDRFLLAFLFSPDA